MLYQNKTTKMTQCPFSTATNINSIDNYMSVTLT